MEAKEYLYQARDMYADIKSLQEKIERCESQLEGMGISYDGDQFTKSTTNRTTELMVEFAHYREHLQAIQESYVKREKELEYIIHALDSPAKRRAVRMHVVDGMSYGRIAKETGYSKSGVQHQIESSIEFLQDKLVPLIQDFKVNTV